MKDAPQLQDTLDEAEWSWLKAHAERDGLIIVDSKLVLLEVGKAMAQDSSDQVKGWIQKGLISKPSQKQLDAWNQNPTKKFLSLVVQPYVLIQEVLLH